MSSAPSAAPRAEGADDWDAHWDAYADAAARNPAQAYRRRLALQLLERRGAPRRLLDIGSGQGDFLQAAAARWPQAELAGVEVSERGVEESRAKAPGAKLVVRDLLRSESPPSDLNGWATHAVCSEVLEHVDDPARLMSNAQGWLEPGARVVVTVPGGRMSAFDRHIGHRQHFTPESITSVLRDGGYQVRWAAGAGFPTFNLYRQLVIARGDALVDDVESGGEQQPSLASRVAMAAFHPLFALALPRTPWGTQIVAVAERPRPSL